ncbi:hypothetical protein BN1232_03668 [Mycobacterium lentiflavum]|uniref:Uncharacterized protein n=1 Tax=Mycobacterium lentiflavum TaxID=141349 RepID=A0A0E4CP44_MYCLN|nr:hypothetical protein BN1232_03668 [Mycobacterium lentiflavum]
MTTGHSRNNFRHNTISEYLTVGGHRRRAPGGILTPPALGETAVSIVADLIAQG